MNYMYFNKDEQHCGCWLYSLIYGDDELLSKCIVQYDSDYTSTDSYVITI